MKRMKPNVRKDEILQAALFVAERDGYLHMRREDIASEANVSVGLVSRYFGTMEQMKRAVMRHAVMQKKLSLIAQGIAHKNPHAMKAPEDVKQAAVQTMLE